MLKEQKGVCAICHQPETAIGRGGKVVNLGVDHDHVTGQVRHLLCYRCNTSLGLLRENPEIIERMLSYARISCV
jgi:hypothetical protein